MKIKKFLFWLSIILAIIAISLAFMPLVKSPLVSLGWTTIFIISIPGILAIIATVFALKNRIIGTIMFLMLTLVYSYFISSGLLGKEYLIITGIFLVVAMTFFLSRPKQDQDGLVTANKCQ